MHFFAVKWKSRPLEELIVSHAAFKGSDFQYGNLLAEYEYCGDVGIDYEDEFALMPREKRVRMFCAWKIQQMNQILAQWDTAKKRERQAKAQERQARARAQSRRRR